MLLTIVLLTTAALVATQDPQNVNGTSPDSSMSSSMQTTPMTNSTMDMTTMSMMETTPGSMTESPRNSSGRAINFNMAEDGAENNSSEPEKGSLQDLSLDDIDMSSLMTTLPVTSEASMSDMNMTEDMCTEGSVMYKVGDMFNRSCEEVCKCEAGAKVECSPRCVQPTFRRGARQLDPMCYEHPAEDPCCAVLVCTHDTDPEPLEGCTFKNETYQRGDVFNDGCEAVCTCGEAGKLACKPRCPAMPNNSSDRCVTLTDPTDSCCTVVRCDVTLGDHDASEVGQEEHTNPLQLLIAEFVNASAVRLELAGDAPLNVTIEASMDQQVWKLQPSKGLLVLDLEPGHTYYLRANAGGVVSNVVEVVLPKETPSNSTDMEKGVCIYKGQNYTLNQEFHDGCEAFCVCTETGVECANIDCPTEFGLDLVDSHCLEWDINPDGFVPVPPRCCPDKVQCKNNGSCEYQGELYSNWAEVPTAITGCEKRCFCQFGNVTCQSVCPPVTATPPADIQCQPQEAILGHLPEDDCCLYWICPPLHHPGPGIDDKKLGHAETGHRQQNMSSTGQILPGPTKFDSYSFPLGNTLQRHPSMPSSEQPFLGPFNPDHLHPSPTPQQKRPDSNKSKPQLQDNGLLVPGPTSPQWTNNSQTDTGNVNVAMHPNKLDHHMNMQGVNNKHKIQVEEHPENDENSDENIGPYKVQPPFLPQHPHDIVDWIHPHLEEHVPEPQTDPPQQIKPEQNVKKAGPVRKPAVPPVNKAPQDQDTPDIDVDALLEHLHQQGVLPPQYTVYQHQPPSSKPELEEEILAHLQHQGVLPRPDGKHPPLHPGADGLYTQGQQPTQHRVPPSQRPKKPDTETEHNILVHLQEQGFIPPQHGLPPQGKHPKRPQNDKPHESEEDILAQFQQGLLPFQQQPQGRPVPGHPQTIPDPYHQHPSGKPLPPHSLPHPFQQRPSARPQPIPDEELLLHLQQQGLIPPQYTIHPGSPPPPPPHFLIPPGQFKVPHLNQSHAEFGITSLPTGFSQLPHIHNGHQPDEVVIQTLVPLDPYTVRLVFSVPPVLVGLHGRVELRYTSDKQNNDISTWEQQVLAPPKDLIATPQLEFSLGGLQPDTEYRIKITVILRDLHNSPSSSVVAVRTLPAPSTTLPPVIAVQPNLSAAEANSSWITVTWRKFDDFELQLIDGIQLRYKELDDKVYSTTPLIHRAVTSYVLEGLKPSTTYEIGIFFIPFPGQSTELQADSAIQVTTAEVQDLYKFDVRVEVHHIKSTSVEVNWTGVPYPVDKYVNIFRVIYQSDSGKEDFSTFKVAKRNLPASTLIKDLIPGTRYRLWLEVYLTNGKIMKSNVQDFSTRPGSVSSVDSSQQGKLESVPTPVNQAGDYYSPLVAVAILAALAILATLILLLILMRKNSQHKAAISSSRKSQSAYDNPSYKTCEDQPAANGTGTAKPTAAEPS